MSVFQAQQARKQSADQFRAIADYAYGAEMILKRDSVKGYWLHFGNNMRWIEHLCDVQGWVDYLEREEA